MTGISEQYCNLLQKINMLRSSMILVLHLRLDNYNALY